MFLGSGHLKLFLFFAVCFISVICTSLSSDKTRISVTIQTELCAAKYGKEFTHFRIQKIFVHRCGIDYFFVVVVVRKITAPQSAFMNLNRVKLARANNFFGRLVSGIEEVICCFNFFFTNKYKVHCVGYKFLFQKLIKFLWGLNAVALHAVDSGAAFAHAASPVTFRFAVGSGSEMPLGSHTKVALMMIQIAEILVVFVLGCRAVQYVVDMANVIKQPVFFQCLRKFPSENMEA